MTQESTETDTIEDLDWNHKPPCEVDVTTLRDGIQNCQKPAAWLGIAPCGHEGYSCDPHKHDGGLYWCRECGRRDMPRHNYRWIKL